MTETEIIYDNLVKYGVEDLARCQRNTGRELVLSPPAARAVATGMFMLYAWDLPTKRLVPLNAEGLAELRHIVNRDWDLASEQQARQRLNDLCQAGHRATLQPQLVQNEARWRVEFDKYPLLRDNPVTSVAAWDYGRIATLAYWCLVLGYLDTTTVFRYMDWATQASLERFNSWQEFAVSYLAGRCMWNPNDTGRQEAYTSFGERHLTSQVRCWASSPWAEYTPWPWATTGQLT